MGQGGTPTGTAKEGYRPSTAKSRRQVAGCDHKKGRELDGPEPVHTCVDYKPGGDMLSPTARARPRPKPLRVLPGGSKSEGPSTPGGGRDQNLKISDTIGPFDTRENHSMIPAKCILKNANAMHL